MTATKPAGTLDESETHVRIRLLESRDRKWHTGPVYREWFQGGFRYWFRRNGYFFRCVNFGGTCGWQEIETAPN